MAPSLILVRHGRTAWNRAGRYQGWADVPLDDEGAQQARALAALLAGAVGPGAVVVSSDLQRASVTAHLIAASLKVPVIEHPGLREVDLGAWEGLTRTEAEARFPEEFRGWEERGEGWLDVRRGGGETLTEAGRRFADGLSEALAAAVTGGRWQPEVGDAVVVAHGLVLQAALHELSSRGYMELDGEPPHLGNCEHITFRLDRSLIAPEAATAGRPG